MGESLGTSASSPNIQAPSSIVIMRSSNSWCSPAWTATALPSLKSMEKLSISTPWYERGSVATRVPSHLPLRGEVKTSSLGILGLKSTPVVLRVSQPPTHLWPGISQQVKSVPLGA